MTYAITNCFNTHRGALWFSSRVLDSRSWGCRFKPHRITFNQRSLVFRPLLWPSVGINALHFMSGININSWPQRRLFRLLVKSVLKINILISQPNICCGDSSFEHQKHMFKLMGILTLKNNVYLNLCESNSQICRQKTCHQGVRTPKAQTSLHICAD